jgi:hypothetical protein
VDASYDKQVDVLVLRTRDGKPKYVAVGKDTFVIFADDNGIWGIDLEAEEWYDDPYELTKKIKIEVFERLEKLNRLIPPKRNG